MARLKTIGFELNDLTAGVEVTSGSGTLNTVSTTTVRSGTYAARINPAAGFRWIGQVFKSSPSSTETFIRVYINFASLPTGGQCEIIGIWDSVSVARRAYIGLSTAGKLQLFDNSVQIGSDSATLSTGTWYRVEIRVIGGTGTATLDGRLDGSSFASSTSATVSNFDALYFGAPNAANSFDGFWDDIAINDTSGSDQNSWAGSGKVIVLTPNASGDANSFATRTGGTAGASNNYTRVDEVAPNDATDFNGSSTLNEEDLFNMSDSGIASSDVVKVVHVDIRFRNGTADATAAIKAEVEKTASGTKTQSSAIVPNSTTWKSNSTTTGVGHTLTTYQDPDAAAWTLTTLDSMQAGYKLTTAPGTAGRTIDVTKVWATVDYNPSLTKTLTETVTHTDSVVKQGKKVLLETITHTDSILKSLSKIFTETQTSTDTLTKQPAKTLTDTITHTDTLTRLAGKVLSETSNLTDTLERMAAKVFSETTNLTDAIVRFSQRTFTETVTLTDSLIRSVGKVLSDTLSFTDSLVRTTGRVLSETITHTDTIITSMASAAYSKTLEETANLTDSIVRLTGKVFTETVSLVDSVIRLLNGLSVFFSDKFSNRGSSYSDKNSSRGTSYSDKNSTRSTSYDDKYSTRNL